MDKEADYGSRDQRALYAFCETKLFLANKDGSQTFTL